MNPTDDMNTTVADVAIDADAEGVASDVDGE